MELLQEFTSLIKETLNPDQIVTDKKQISEAETTTFETKQKIILIIFPQSTLQVQKVVEAANKYNLPFYPSSKGRNWGYGSKVPVTSSSILLDLSQMNQIHDYNEDFGYITVGPGVSIEQIHNYLALKKSKWIIPPGGMIAESSAIGNAMERGFAAGHAGDRVNQVSDFEVVLPTSEVIYTGLSRFENSTAKNLHKYGLGPSFDGIFSQSNLGIVTRMTIWLAKKPNKYFLGGMMTFTSEEQLGKATDTLRSLVQNRLIATPFGIWNSTKILAIKQQYPWLKMNDVTPITKSVEKELLQKSFNLPVGEWNCLFGTHSYSFLEMLARRSYLFKNLKPVSNKLVLLTQWHEFFAKAIRKPYLFFTQYDPVEAFNIGYKKSSFWGILSIKGLSPVYWRRKSKIPENPDPNLDGCGLLWVTCSLPFTGEHITRVNYLIKSNFEKFKFDPMITLIFMDDKLVVALAAIKYDRTERNNESAAQLCQTQMQEELFKNGYIPYRLGINKMEYVYKNAKGKEFYKKLKSILDPKNVCAPGRYE
jgi:4-cresol dehydrogenase (hydroxylating)